MKLNFKEWLILTEGSRGAKLGLYPPIADQLGQYPPLYMTTGSADFIYYYDRMYPNNGIDDWEKGIINPEELAGDTPSETPIDKTSWTLPGGEKGKPVNCLKLSKKRMIP